MVMHENPQEVSFIGPWGTLNFHLPQGGLSQMRGLKISTLFWGGGGGGGGSKGKS